MRIPAIVIRTLGALSRDPAAYAAATALRRAGGDVYLVGGVVRDVVMGYEPEDVDLLVRLLRPEAVREALESVRLGRVTEVGKSFGVFEFRLGGGSCQVALPRTERSTGAGHRDFDVDADPALPVERDLMRRDYTCNAIAVSVDGRVVDPTGGLADAGLGVVHHVSAQAMAEDPLRLLRGLSLVSRRGMTLTFETLNAMHAYSGAVADLAAERVMGELDKIMAGDDPATAVRLAQESGVLRSVMPEVDACFGYDQNTPWHEHELGEHLLRVLRETCRLSADPDLRLAALLHDVGKPRSAWVDPVTGHNHYYLKRFDDGTVAGLDHAVVGSEMVWELMGRLRYPRDRIARVSRIVRHHMYDGFETRAGAKRFVARVGEDIADDLIALRAADSSDHAGGGQQPEPRWDHAVNQRLVDEVRAAGDALSRADLAVDGRDLIEAGVPEGPEIGRQLSRLLEVVMEDPALNDRETLLGMLRAGAAPG